MSINKEEAMYIAKLSKLEFTDNELDKITKDLSEIVDMASMNASVDTKGVKQTMHILENINVFRKDEAKPSFDREEILKNAPSKEAGCISVPKVVE